MLKEKRESPKVSIDTTDGIGIKKPSLTLV